MLEVAKAQTAIQAAVHDRSVGSLMHESSLQSAPRGCLQTPKYCRFTYITDSGKLVVLTTEWLTWLQTS